jgi:hypothetical protein
VLKENLDKSLMAGGIGMHHPSGRQDRCDDCDHSHCLPAGNTEQMIRLSSGSSQVAIEDEHANRR